jgi:hypothetical protein
LRFKIEDLEKIINSAPAHIQEAVYSNDWDESGIDLYKYAQIMHPYDLYSDGIINNCSVMIHLSKPSEIPSDTKNTQSIQSYYKLGPKILKSPMFKCGYLEFPPPPTSELEKNVQNEIYDLTVTYRYLERLRQMKISSSKNTKQRDYNNKPKSSGSFKDIEDGRINRFIDDTAESISKHGKAKYQAETIKLYLRCYVNHPELSRNDISERAAENATSQKIKEELIRSINKGARAGWEEKLDRKIEKYTSMRSLK